MIIWYGAVILLLVLPPSCKNVHKGSTHDDTEFTFKATMSVLTHAPAAAVVHICTSLSPLLTDHTMVYSHTAKLKHPTLNSAPFVSCKCLEAVWSSKTFHETFSCQESKQGSTHKCNISSRCSHLVLGWGCPHWSFGLFIKLCSWANSIYKFISHTTDVFFFFFLQHTHDLWQPIVGPGQAWFWLGGESKL